jgi:hypothetical protein
MRAALPCSISHVHGNNYLAWASRSTLCGVVTAGNTGSHSAHIHFAFVTCKSRHAVQTKGGGVHSVSSDDLWATHAEITTVRGIRTLRPSQARSQTHRPMLRRPYNTTSMTYLCVELSRRLWCAHMYGQAAYVCSQDSHSWQAEGLRLAWLGTLILQQPIVGASHGQKKGSKAKKKNH